MKWCLMNWYPMKKNVIRLFSQLVAAMAAVLLLANGMMVSAHAEGKKTVTVTTSFLRDMVKQLAGDLVDMELIIPPGEDPHLYVAQPQDMEKIMKADLLLYHGLHFEGKIAEILEMRGVAVSKDFDTQSVGMMEQDGETVLDPHFWFDLTLYEQAVHTAAEALRELLPDHGEQIASSEADYVRQLRALDQEIREKLAAIPEESRYLVTPHDAFNYFSRSYGVEVVAPQGVSTDTEVSGKDIENTVNFIVDHQIKAIFAETTTNPERMEKLREAAAAKGWNVTVVQGEGRELFSDSLAPEGKPGDTFLDMYRHNVDLMVEYLK